MGFLKFSTWTALFFLVSNETLLSQNLELSWDMIEQTTYQDRYYAEDDAHYWVPSFSQELRQYAGCEVVMSGYVDSTTFDGRFFLIPNRDIDVTMYDRKLAFIELVGVDRRVVEHHRVQVSGILELNDCNLNLVCFRLHGNANGQLPPWIPLLRSEEPNAQMVREAYEKYYHVHPFQKTRYTQEYKRWIVQNRAKFTHTGELDRSKYIQRTSTGRGGGEIWSYAGPMVHYDSDGSMTPGFRHSNVYCHDRSSQNSQVLFCGTESGGAYKTVDGEQNRTHVTSELIIIEGIIDNGFM
jgi:hypothetical protein